MSPSKRARAPPHNDALAKRATFRRPPTDRVRLMRCPYARQNPSAGASSYSSTSGVARRLGVRYATVTRCTHFSRKTDATGD